MLVQELQGRKIYRVPRADRRYRKDGTPRSPRRLGIIHFPVFTADGRLLIGFMVKLRDVAGMVRRPDRFIARDALRVYEAALAIEDERDSFDGPAARRLGVELDRCLIWTGMDVRTVSGKQLGYCSDAEIDLKSGEVSQFMIIAGAASSMLVGNVRMPADMLVGYRDGAMIVCDEVRSLELSGGAAAKAAEAGVVIGAKAAEASATIGRQVKRGAKVLDDRGAVALTKGTRALGKQLGRTRGMFRSFKDEYKKASGPPSKKPRGR